MTTRLLSVMLLATCALLACRPEPPAPPARLGDGAPPAPEPPTTAAAGIDPGGMSEPGILSINGEVSGPVFLDGRRLADGIPLENHLIPAGRHAVQILSNDGANLSPPRFVVVRTGVNVAVYVRNASGFGTLSIQNAPEGSGIPSPDLVVAPPADGSGQGVRPSDGSAAAIAAFPTDTATPTPGSGDPPDGSGPTNGSAPSDGSAPATPALGSGEPADADAPDAHSETGEGHRTLTLITDPNTQPLSTVRIQVTSEPAGQLFVDGLATGLQTPVVFEVTPGVVTVQVVQENGDLSRHLPVEGLAGQGRQVHFTGRDNLMIR
jgi:hypothetical protein